MKKILIIFSIFVLVVLVSTCGTGPRKGTCPSCGEEEVLSEELPFSHIRVCDNCFDLIMCDYEKHLAYERQEALNEGYNEGYNDGLRDSANELVTRSAEAEQHYVLNKNTMRFHYPWCASVSQIKDENRWDYTASRSRIISLGYEPCERCNP